MKRKSKLMRASGVLLVLTLITSSLVGGTFAKYVTTNTGTDSARVAKWGVNVAVNKGAFKTEYESDVDGSGVELAVKSAEEVVAPGTYGTFSGVIITGDPEVAVTVSTTADFELDENWTVNPGTGDEYYCPIVIQVDDTQYCGLDYESADLFEQDVEAAINSYLSGTFEPDDTITLPNDIQWRWAFDYTSLENTPVDTFAFTNEVKTTLSTEQIDTKDTALGNKTVGSLPTVSLELTTTVTQVD